jgi:ATPase subunit of ABC transporter with duplicated ATPase domains
MCITLAKTLFMNPTILLLDEQTNHLGESLIILATCYCPFRH